MYKFSIMLLSLIEECIFLVRQVTSKCGSLSVEAGSREQDKTNRVSTNHELKINNVVYSHTTLNNPDLV